MPERTNGHSVQRNTDQQISRPPQSYADERAFHTDVQHGVCSHVLIPSQVISTMSHRTHRVEQNGRSDVHPGRSERTSIASCTGKGVQSARIERTACSVCARLLRTGSIGNRCAPDAVLSTLSRPAAVSVENDQGGTGRRTGS